MKTLISPRALPWPLWDLLHVDVWGWCSGLTLHDRYVHSSPTRARYTAETRSVGDGWTASARHEASPADTNTDTNAQTSLNRGTAPRVEVTHTVASRCCWYKDIYSSLVPKKMEENWTKIRSRAFLTSPEFTTLPVYFWRFAFDFGTLLHHLFCHSSTVIKHRDDAQDEFHIHTHAHHTHITRQPGVTRCHESHHCSAMCTVHEHHDWVNSVNSALCNWITTSQTNAHRLAGKKYQNNDHGLPFNSKLNIWLTWLVMSLHIHEHYQIFLLFI